MSTPWKNSCRIEVRKRLKWAGLDSYVKVANGEDLLNELEIGLLVPRRDGQYLRTTGLHAAINNHRFKVKVINEFMAVVRLVHVSERTA